MKLNANTEWAIIAALIVYIAFIPGVGGVRQFLSSGIGMVVALAAVVYVWKFVSQPIAILLLVAVLRCAGMRERMTNPNAHCPAPFILQDDNTCKDEKGASGPPPTICLEGQTWNAAVGKCEGASASTSVGIPPSGPTGTSTPTPPMSSTGMASPTTEGFVPNSKENKYAPA